MSASLLFLKLAFFVSISSFSCSKLYETGAFNGSTRDYLAFIVDKLATDLSRLDRRSILSDK